jgi:hypothetical protein
MRACQVIILVFVRLRGATVSCRSIFVKMLDVCTDSNWFYFEQTDFFKNTDPAEFCKLHGKTVFANKNIQPATAIGAQT